MLIKNYFIELIYAEILNGYYIKDGTHCHWLISKSQPLEFKDYVNIFNGEIIIINILEK